MDEETTGQTPEEEPTSALPPADEGATEAMGGAEQPTTVMGADAGATRVMPAAGAAAPPPEPPRPTPTLMMSRPPQRESSGKTWWIVLIVVILAAAAAAGLWYFVLRNKNTAPAATPTPTPTASAVKWGGAWGRTDGVAGGIVVEQSGSVYHVTVYDSGLQPTGTATGSVSADGKQLSFTLPAGSSFDTMPGPLTGVMTIQPGDQTALLAMTAANQTSITMPLKRVLALVPGTPSPSSSASPTTTGSPSPSASPISVVDQKIIAGITKIQTGLTTWAANNGDLYPLPAEVGQTGGIAQYVVPWPLNPVTNQPMVQGGAVGNYTYQQINGGQSYTLVGHLSNGVSYTLP